MSYNTIFVAIREDDYEPSEVVGCFATLQEAKQAGIRRARFGDTVAVEWGPLGSHFKDFSAEGCGRTVSEDGGKTWKEGL